MSKKKSESMCRGCYNDFYNHTNMGANMKDGAPRCWSWESAEVTRKKFVHVDQRPPWHGPAVTTLTCHRKQRYVAVDPKVTR